MRKKRTDKIIEYMINHNNSASVFELCEEFNVSDMTIRRDLQSLENEDRISRHHGGATIIRSSNSPFNADPFQNRLNDNHDLKMAIGAAAAEYLHEISSLPNCNSIFIASGSTMYCMALQMNFPLENITLVTDNVYTSQVLASNPEHTVVSIGGQLILPSLNVVGYVAENMIRSFSLDYAFISAGSIDTDGTIYYYNFIENGTFNAAVESSRNIIVVADSTKFGKKTFVQLCKLKKGFTLITDSGISNDFYNLLIKNKVKVIVIPFEAKQND